MTTSATIHYACPHLLTPGPPGPPSSPSSSFSLHPLSTLYFCEECDAIRCDLCVAVEVASYFCPNCLFDVPSANVRGDRSRNCFSCPTCQSSLSVQAITTHTSTTTGKETSKADTAYDTTITPGGSSTNPAYILVCAGCKWSSKEVGWVFEKPTGIASEYLSNSTHSTVQRIHTQAEKVQTEFDALKDHLESFMALSPASTPSMTPGLLASKIKGGSKQPTRHISHLTQMAARALHRDGTATSIGTDIGSKARYKLDGVGKEPREKWYEMEQYVSSDGARASDAGKDLLAEDERAGRAPLESVWGLSWAGDRSMRSLLPERISLQTKLTKRCPHPNCRHLLIQPDTKSTRMKIKMVAGNYLPAVELGRRRRLISDAEGIRSVEEMDVWRKERRRARLPPKEEDESITADLGAGEVIRLTQPKSSAQAKTHHIHIPTQHFTVSAMKDAWAYDEEDDDDHLGQGLDDASEEGSTISGATAVKGSSISKRSRLSVLGAGSVRDKRGRESGVEKRGNVSKVGVEVEVMPGASGIIESDLEVRYTYRADETEAVAGGDGEGQGGKKEYKTFTFWVRASFGEVV